MANPTPDYPTSIHSATDVSGYTGSNLGQTTLTHTEVEGKQEEEIRAAQYKLGAGSAVPAAGAFLQGNAAGSSTWTSPGTLPMYGSGIAILQSGTNAVIAFIGSDGNFYISGNYLKL